MFGQWRTQRTSAAMPQRFEESTTEYRLIETQRGSVIVTWQICTGDNSEDFGASIRLGTIRICGCSTTATLLG
jgi:hypothetical protein